MAKLSDLTTADELHERDMQNPEYAAEYERTRLANEVALAVSKYRVDKGWSQARLAEHLGMKQPAIARLEAGEHKPTVDTLERLARANILSVEIQPTGSRVHPLAQAS